MSATDADSDQPAPVAYIGDIRLEHWEQAERAIFHAREGNKLFLRAADPCDPESDRIPYSEGDQVIGMEHFEYIRYHTAAEGADGYLLPLRMVPVREEPGKLFARTLRYGEHDDGRRVHARPGDVVVVESSELNIDYIDDWEGEAFGGYVPLAAVLFTWMCFGTHHSDEKRRYLLSAGRRLDQAHTLFVRVGELRQVEPEGAPAVRRALFNLIGVTELAVVALHRTISRCAEAPSALRTTLPVPDIISLWHNGLRAVGDPFGPRPDAVGASRAGVTVETIEPADTVTATGTDVYDH